MARIIAGLAALLVALCFATGALAHASLVSADPADGSVLPQPPKTLQLRFNESVTPAVVSLIDADGKTREVTAHAVDQTVVVVLPDDLPQGTQVVSYRVVSQDGHPVAGSLMFSIGVVTGGATPASSAFVPVLIWLFRIGVYLGLFAGVGGVFFAAWIGWGPSGARVIIGSLRVGLVSAVVSLGLQGLDLLNLPLSGLMSFAPWKSALGTSLGPSLLIASARGVAKPDHDDRMAVDRSIDGRRRTVAGNQQSRRDRAAGMGDRARRVHPRRCGRLLGRRARALARAGAEADRRGASGAAALFERVAMPVVGLLVLSGFGLAIVQLESFGALIGTRYGLILLVKLTLVAILLGLAAMNRYLVMPAIKADLSDARTLKGVVFYECVAVLGILAVVAGWRFTPPPRALAAAAQAAAQAPLAIHIHTDTAVFQVLIRRAKWGRTISCCN